MGNLVEDKVEVLRKRAQREIDEGVLPSCQFALALNGELVAHESFGDAELDTRYVIFSATKPVVASAAWIMIQKASSTSRRRWPTTSTSSRPTART